MDYKYINDNIIENLKNDKFKNNLIDLKNKLNNETIEMESSNGFELLDDDSKGIANNVVKINDKLYPLKEKLSDIECCKLYSLNDGMLIQNQFIIPINEDDLFEINLKAKSFLQKVDTFNEYVKDLGYSYNPKDKGLYLGDKLVMITTERFENIIFSDDGFLDNKNAIKDYLDNMMLDNLTSKLNDLDANVSFSIRILGIGKYAIDTIVDNEINTSSVVDRDSLLKVFDIANEDVELANFTEKDYENIALTFIKKNNIEKLLKDLENNKLLTDEDKILDIAKNKKKYIGLTMALIGLKVSLGNMLDDKEKEFIRDFARNKENANIHIIDSHSVKNSIESGEIDELKKLFILEKQFTNTKGFDNEVIAMSYVDARKDVNSRFRTLLMSMLDNEYQRDLIEDDLVKLKELQKELEVIEKQEESLGEKLNEKFIQRQILELKSKEEEERYKEELAKKENEKKAEETKKKMMKIVLGLALFANPILSLGAYGVLKYKENKDEEKEEKTIYEKIKEQNKKVLETMFNTILLLNHREQNELLNEEYKITVKKELDGRKFAELTAKKNSIMDLIKDINAMKVQSGVLVGNMFDLELNVNKIDAVRDATIDVKSIQVQGIGLDSKNNLHLNPNTLTAVIINNEIKKIHMDYTVINNIQNQTILEKELVKAEKIEKEAVESEAVETEEKTYKKAPILKM